MEPAPALARELDTSRRLARAAGAIIIRCRDEGIEVETKAGGEPVTRADREASALIVGELARVFPDDVIISEEGADDPRRVEAAARVWFVDPLDGTRDFVAGLPGFAVMIGLAVGGRPRLGVVYQPVGDRLYYAAQGSGAFVVETGGQPRRLRCSQVTDLAAIRLVASRTHRTEKIDEIKRALGTSDEENLGSVGLKIGLIAMNRRDLYVNPTTHCKAWDTCAPEAILEEAGGRLTDLHGSLLTYDVPDLRRLHGLVASNGLLHPAVLERLAPLFPRP